jgi:O-acetyl-ADP-ribose deacetylase (regulator of RNase III)
MELVFFDPEEEFCSAMEKYLEFESLTAKVVHGTLADVSAFDCVIGGMNSFGILDAGIDLQIARFFGDALQTRVQQRIMDDCRGEQQIGTALVIPTEHAEHPYFIHAPIMRVTMRIAYTDHVYNALFAALVAIDKHNSTAASPIKVIACPSLGTREGGLPLAQCARQLMVAYKYFNRPPEKLDWHMANNRQQEIRYGGDDGYHFPPEWA